MNLGRQSQSLWPNSTLIELWGSSFGDSRLVSKHAKMKSHGKCPDNFPRKSPAKAVEHVLADRSGCFTDIFSFLRWRNANKDMVSPCCLHEGQIPVMCTCTASHARAQCHKKGMIPPLARMWPAACKVALPFVDIALP